VASRRAAVAEAEEDVPRLREAAAEAETAAADAVDQLRQTQALLVRLDTTFHHLILHSPNTSNSIDDSDDSRYGPC
jgi:hypothetical protein